ncbi:hypothetical protein R1flu_029249 [Riccia fluitans]|uniref:Uncharacterized protein n=1 Tax=Riccia fluitans TaxID=41844 RepID=A0ABD1XS00_9MARC
MVLPRAIGEGVHLVGRGVTEGRRLGPRVPTLLKALKALSCGAHYGNPPRGSEVLERCLEVTGFRRVGRGPGGVLEFNADSAASLFPDAFLSLFLNVRCCYSFYFTKVRHGR